MFNDKNVSFVNRQKLWSFYNEKLSKAVDVGYSPDLDFYDEDLAKSLKDNIAQFSAFKETSFKKEVESLLTDGKHLRSKSDFKKEALKVSDDYNYRWLEIERHHTIAVANMASKLKDFEQNVELYPNLKLVSVNDSRVRPEHKVLDGTVRPFNDPFWQSHTPPLDWGCRCDLEQTDDDVTEVPGGFQTKIEFKNNPVDSGKIFGGSAYEQSLTQDDKNDALSLLAPEHAPKNLQEYEDEFSIKVDRDFFHYVGKETPFKIERNSKQGAYYMPITNTVHIPIDERRRLSKWKAESVVYHEFGHAADWHHDLKNKDEVKKLMKKYRKEIDFPKVDKELFDLGFKAYTENDHDTVEKVGAARDTLMSLNTKYGSGHQLQYWKRKGNKEAEFLAHSFENKFAGNDVFEKIMPELYTDTIELIDKIKPK